MKAVNNKLISLVFFSVLIFGGCKEDESETPISIKPAPANSNEITVLVESSLNLSNYTVHTIIDSVNSRTPFEKLYAPAGFSSLLFLTDNQSGEILALAPIERGKSTVSVDLETITSSLLTFTPVYSSLNDEQKLDFLQLAKTSEFYQPLKELVKDILKKREPIFSDRAEFISLLLEINSLPFSDFESEGGKMQFGENFQSYVSKENGLTISNPLASYVYLNFRPLSGNAALEYIIDPRPLFPFFETKVTGTEIGLKDDCYELQINQNDPKVYKRNQDAIVDKLVTLILQTLLTTLDADGISGCVTELSAQISIDLGIIIAQAENQSASDILLSTIKTASDLIITGLQEKNCSSLFLNKFAVAKLIASSANMYINIYKAANVFYQFGEMLPLIMALAPELQVDLNDTFQLYNGNLIEACVRLEKDIELKAEYYEEEDLTVKVKLEPLSQYGEWERAGFKIAWSLPPGDGVLSQTGTVTSESGTSFISWKLPKKGGSAVTLTAEMRDREGDHLIGGPIEFQVNLKETDDSIIIDSRDGNEYRIVQIGDQTWFAENLRYDGNIPQVISPEEWYEMRDRGVVPGKPAWAYYDNNSNNNLIYGKLYNWYAVNGGNLCPPGWHIPTLEEWNVLSDFLGGWMIAGGKLKSETGWEIPNIGATNESGFSALPGGDRNQHGAFNWINIYGRWWSSSPIDGGLGTAFFLTSNRLGSGNRFTKGQYVPAHGLSCRCLKD